MEDGHHASFRAEPALNEPNQMIQLDEHVGVTHERLELLCICGGLEVELSHAVSV